MEWTQITVITTGEGADLVADIMSELGSEGVSIKDGADVRELIEKKISWDYVDESLLAKTDGRVYVSGFFPPGTDLAPLHAALERLKKNSVFELGSLEVSASELDSADWENEWRKYYAPIDLGGIVIVPAWMKAPPSGGKPVYIEPGMAFGTGNHETTSMCLELMQRVGLEGATVLDMGCGSGILGVAAAVLGAARVVLSDIDPQAIEAAKGNAELNRVSAKCEFVCGDLDAASVRADAVIANITADVLIRLAETARAALGSGGKLILSGIINARADDVLGAYADGFDLVERRQKGEWQALLLARRP